MYAWIGWDDYLQDAFSQLVTNRNLPVDCRVLRLLRGCNGPSVYFVFVLVVISFLFLLFIAWLLRVSPSLLFHPLLSLVSSCWYLSTNYANVPFRMPALAFGCVIAPKYLYFLFSSSLGTCPYSDSPALLGFIDTRVHSYIHSIQTSSLPFSSCLFSFPVPSCLVLLCIHST